MDKPLQLPEILQEAFTKARESLGLSLKELSVKACLSVRQIEQIENGGSGAFYSTQIKVTAAKKVAKLLNLKEEDAFNFREQIILVKPNPEKLVEKLIESVDTETTVDKKSKPQQGEETPKVVIKNLEPKKLLGGSKANSQSKSNKKPLVVLGIAVALVFSVVNLRPLFFPEPPKEEIALVEAVQETPSANVLVGEVKPAQPAQSEVKSTQPLQAPTPVVGATAFAAVVSAECPEADPVVVRYKPEAPKKSGDVVYMQSKTPQTVCVIDATGRVQNKILVSGTGSSIVGKPPFKVLTLGLNQVDLYFQGSRVRVADNSARTVILEAVEVSLPAASLDSQIR